MSYNTSLSLSDRTAKGFVGFDEPSVYQRNSAFKYLNRIYTVKGDGGDVGSVFFEFVESKPCTEENYYMQRVFKDISKSPDLFPDHRIPQEAKTSFCFGIRGNGVQSLEDLINKVEGWVTMSTATYPVQVISVDPLMLESNPCKMPAKNYDHIYAMENGDCYVPVHLFNPNYVNRWK
jgi:hypothetical protein